MAAATRPKYQTKFENNSDEIEDLVGDVKYTDSQKSVTASNVYSLDFTDSSSDKTDKQNSSGKDTYVIDCDSDDSDDSDQTFPLLNHSRPSKSHSVVTPLQINRSLSSTQQNGPPTKINHDAQVQYESSGNINKSVTTSTHACFNLAQETFTQTSKTIIELAAYENTLRNVAHKSLETQTSLLSIIENRTVEYKIELAETRTNVSTNKSHFNGKNITTQEFYNLTGNPLLDSLDESSSKFPISRTESPKTTNSSANSEILNIINDYSDENFSSNDQIECKVYNGTTDSDSDLEEDSLMEKSERRQDDRDSISDVTSLCNDVEDLYQKLGQGLENQSPDRTTDSKSQDHDGIERRIGILSPLIEESTKKESSILLDITPNDTIATERMLLNDNKEININRMSQEPKTNDFKLPPINNTSNPNCPAFQYTVSIDPLQQQHKHAALKYLFERQDRWEISSRELASGESPMINCRNVPVEDSEKEASLQLPPIEGQYRVNGQHDTEDSVNTEQPFTYSTASISIKNRIKELKMNNSRCSPFIKRDRELFFGMRTAISAQSFTSIDNIERPLFISTRNTQSRSGSPCSSSPNESRLGDVADRGCEALCTELLKRLRSNSWIEVAETLVEMPKVLEKFWNAISENRIADLIRQVSIHADSPRTQVSRTACNTLASIIKNTNYTKKPDFYEAVTTLLVKTGSFSRPVRTAANLALDEIVCDVDLTHCVTALCLHGVAHKSSLVRAASARLLVVCCALASGGRDLLRTRPPSTANARRLMLQSLAVMLNDKNIEVRKYAERLYSILRPLSNFEAFFLTDVDVELATDQMKKYDQILLCSKTR